MSRFYSRCCDCDHLINWDDGAGLCIRCGGRNSRLKTCDRNYFFDDEGDCLSCGLPREDHPLGSDFWIAVFILFGPFMMVLMFGLITFAYNWIWT